jgi:hypothetical protein
MKLCGIHKWLNFSTQGIKSIPNIMNDQNNYFKKKKENYLSFSSTYLMGLFNI